MITPGQWEASPWSSVVGGGVFAQILIAQVRSSHADTLLMAAAPDLLGALRELVRAVDASLPHISKRIQEAMDDTEMAIAKAAGK